MKLGILHHLFYFCVAQTAGRSDSDLLALVSAFISCRHIHDTVGINIERNFDLWYATWCWWNLVQHEASQCFVAIRHLALTL
ncbi:NAD-specific glutamate dehydrogenase [compost metagenome]